MDKRKKTGGAPIGLFSKKKEATLGLLPEKCSCRVFNFEMYLSLRFVMRPARTR